MDVKLPPLGEGADSGTVVSILVKEGDSIAKGQTLIELETGKAVAPIPSPSAGQITKILVQEGAKISVGASILSLGENATAAPPKKAAVPQHDSSQKSPPQNEEIEETAEETEAESDSPVPPAAPSLRRLAQDLGINLRKIRGSETGGRIILADLKTYIQRLQKLAAAKTAASSAVSEKSKPTAPTIDFSKFGPIAKRPMTPLRKVIAQRMTENWNAIPHVTQFDEIDITALMDLRKKYADAYDKKGARLTLTSFALKAVVAALKKNPLFNTSLDEMTEEIIYKEYFHIGLAVDTESGLMVPVIRDVDKKDLATLAKELNQLAEKARERKISLEEMQGGTFTISNQGGIGGAHFTPIVNKPEVAILGLGRGVFKPVVIKENKIEARLMLPVALSYDHRVIDGGSAVRFMLDFIDSLENFKEEEIKT